MTKKQKLIVILGPTASGKSDVAVRLALRLNSRQVKKIGVNGAEIISADSRQVYKGLDIGTGKITKKEMRGVKHHLIDVISPQKTFTASNFVKMTNKTIVQIVTRNKTPIICGGTGFYIDALLGDKQIPEVAPNWRLRKKLEKKSVEELFKMLQKLDPERAQTIDRHNSRRLIRAVEICKTVGRVPRFESRSVNYEVCKIGIKITDEILKKRINKRLSKRLKQGMIAEAKKLHKQRLSYKRMRELGLEYGRLADFLEKKISKEEMVEKLKKEIWQYSKRQMTWFRKDKNIRWIVPRAGRIEKEVEKFLKA